MKTINQKIRIAVVGDVHNQWENADRLALEALEIDLVLFVGDFGNEAVEIVRQIAAIDLPKAAVMGNHDAWYSASVWGQKQCPYDRTQEDRVQQQLDLLGDAHVGYGKLEFPELGLAVVGSRPFSWGGKEWRNKRFLRDRFGVENFDQSADKIVSQALETDSENIIFLGHNGPQGLGEKPEDTCGKDWTPIGGDCGDPDFAEAIARVRAAGKKIPLVTFGHMHHRLRHTQTRLRTRINCSEDGTVYLNSASVPRIKELAGQRLRNFSLVTFEQQTVAEIALVWVGENNRIVSSETLFRRETSALEYEFGIRS